MDQLVFSYEWVPAGYFLDRTEYPTAPGRYRCMPFRSIGHLRLGQACRGGRSAICSWQDGGVEKSCRMRLTDEYGFVEILELPRK
jgi:hypothetical protein